MTQRWKISLFTEDIGLTDCCFVWLCNCFPNFLVNVLWFNLQPWGWRRQISPKLREQFPHQTALHLRRTASSAIARCENYVFLFRILSDCFVFLVQCIFFPMKECNDMLFIVFGCNICSWEKVNDPCLRKHLQPAHSFDNVLLTYWRNVNILPTESWEI